LKSRHSWEAEFDAEASIPQPPITFKVPRSAFGVQRSETPWSSQDIGNTFSSGHR
jgi:hypothetical protein